MNNKLFIFLRRIIYSTLGFFGMLWYRMSPSPVILCYHSVNEDDWFYGVSLKVLEQQLRWMSKYARPVTLHDVYKHITGEKKLSGPCFAVTIDDGYKNLLSAKPLLDSLGIKPALFVLSSPQTAAYDQLTVNYEFLTPKELRELHESGWTIASHSATHSDFWALTPERITTEVEASKRTLETQVGVPVEFFAFPRGRYTPEILEAVKTAGYRMALSMDDGIIQTGMDPYTVPRTGINRSHSLSEFKSSFTPATVHFRTLAKLIMGKYTL